MVKKEETIIQSSHSEVKKEEVVAEVKQEPVVKVEEKKIPGKLAPPTFLN